MNEQLAQIVGIGALEWLVANDELLPVFLGASGATLDQVKENAGNPELLASVLEFLMNDDEWVKGCCDANEWPHETLMQARLSMPGGAVMNWT
ncbi:MAG: DUF3572 domain-containing protein [Brevirhabdus sp.]